MNDSVWFWIVAGLVLVFWIFKIIKHRGVRGAMYGAELGPEVGELILNPSRLAKSTVKVHRLTPTNLTDGPHVGMELGFSSVLGAWEMRPVPLTRAQAKELSKLLAQAAQ